MNTEPRHAGRIDAAARDLLDLPDALLGAVAGGFTGPPKDVGRNLASAEPQRAGAGVEHAVI